MARPPTANCGYGPTRSSLKPTAVVHSKKASATSAIPINAIATQTPAPKSANKTPNSVRKIKGYDISYSDPLSGKTGYFAIKVSTNATVKINSPNTIEDWGIQSGIAIIPVDVSP